MKKELLIIALFISTTCSSQNNARLKLWYSTPSGKTWENALPIGNGRLGAMIYGNPPLETIQLNEHTLWSGGPNRNDNPLALDSLAALRQLIFAGKQKEAERMANRIIISKKSHGQMFEPAGELNLSFSGHDNYTNYYRELDIERAVAKTSYQVGSVTYTREVLASLPDRVIVMHLTASKPGSISFTAFYTTPQPNAVIKANAAGELNIAGTTIDHEGVKGMVKYKCVTHLKTIHGSLSSTDTSLIVKDADEATIYISIATNFNNYPVGQGSQHFSCVSYRAHLVRCFCHGPFNIQFAVIIGIIVVPAER